MKIAIGSDHAGVEVKAKIMAILEGWGHEMVDFGTDSKESCDYPDFGLRVAHAVADNNVETGINVCWTGNDMAIASNKVNGIRAGIAINEDMAMLTRSHNDANLLVIGQKYTREEDLEPILKAFLETEFEGGRHIPRVQKIMDEEGRG
jgi:ribose 5-phosphate isomerase B